MGGDASSRISASKCSMISEIVTASIGEGSALSASTSTSSVPSFAA
jgi:hypothetical protein